MATSAGVRFARAFVNRNPRNLEASGLQRRPTGFEFEKDAQQRQFIYKVELLQGKSHQEARITHYRDGVVLSASTKEKAVSNQLYSNTDTCAALNVGRLLAVRALQSGILRVMPVGGEETQRSKHQSAFLEALVKEGLILGELEAPEQSYEVDRKMTWSRFPIHHTREDKIDEQEH